MGHRFWAVTAPGAAAIVAMVTVAGCSGSHGGARAQGDDLDISRLLEATTYSTVLKAPLDTNSSNPGDGTVLHPKTPQPVYERPGGPPIARLPVTQLNSPAWMPVIASRAGWHQVLLPSRPNGATGWVAANDSLQVAYTPYVIKVGLSDRRLILLKSGRQVGSWKVAVGTAATPTPVGRTFLLSSLKGSKTGPSPLILPVGAHSQARDTIGGGPGTVALHGWRDRSVFGRASTHGSVAVPKKALKALSVVPLGSLVLISK
ncbi:L,D-transpeptidase [Actinomadura latina]|nr:L,D-transpeptidase [Actinomadura latina]